MNWSSGAKPDQYIFAQDVHVHNTLVLVEWNVDAVIQSFVEEVRVIGKYKLQIAILSGKKCDIQRKNNNTNQNEIRE